MQLTLNLKSAVLAGATFALLGAGVLYAANKYAKPKSVLHVVTVAYQEGTTDEQRKSVLDGIEKMAAEIPGIKNVWLKGVKVQGFQYEKLATGKEKYHRMTDAFVIEFESAAALDAYAVHPAHRAWEKIYVPLRARSATSDITND